MKTPVNMNGVFAFLEINIVVGERPETGRLLRVDRLVW